VLLYVAQLHHEREDEDAETFMAQLEIENDHLGASAGARMR
jgi:hypothetical protein